MEERRHGGGPDRKGPWVRLAVALVAPPVDLLTRRDWRGQARVPRRGGVLLAVNHIGYADPFVVARFVYAAGRVPRFLVKAEAFELEPWGRVLDGAEQIRVRRRAPEAADALRDAVAALRGGAAVVVYPEGTVTRDPDHWPMRGKTGIGRLALETGAPVLPVAQWGAHRLLDERGRPRLTSRPVCSFSVGEPVDLSRWRDAGSADRDAARAATDAVMDRVRAQLAELRGEEPPRGLWDRDAGRRVDPDRPSSADVPSAARPSERGDEERRP